MTAPNFRYADTIMEFQDCKTQALLEEMRAHRFMHRNKFIAAARWLLGSNSNDFVIINDITKENSNARICNGCDAIVEEGDLCREC